jgi:hypothetical protein
LEKIILNSCNKISFYQIKSFNNYLSTIKINIMKMQLTSMLLLMGVSSSIFNGCKKEKDHFDTTITETFTSKTATKDGATYYGTFAATGGLNLKGPDTMDVRLTTDSSFCHTVLTSSRGTITMLLNCSRTNMTGHWRIVNGTGAFASFYGNGPLTMMFPPNVPAGVLVIETITGEIFEQR